MEKIAASMVAPDSAPAGNRTSRSLVYGLTLLRQFTAEQPVRGIAELAEILNVSRPTAHRYASTCLELGYLEQAPMRRYRLARRAAEPGLALLGSLPLVRRAQPVLRELRRRSGRTASLATLDGADVLYLQRLCGFAPGQYELDRGLGAGTRRPARHTAAGEALLARSGEHTHRPRRIRDDGLVVVDGGLRADARGLAVAIQTPGERTYAIEATVPAHAMSVGDATGELGDALRAAAAVLQRRPAAPRATQRVAS
ncbi:MAG TPA: helix-turn-helix domain-containing protein [Solirubrobacteraceae bacterium]|nr:helix-turn-helix domain-containing protein [Solirubrobacteraceae bacterium]